MYRGTGTNLVALCCTRSSNDRNGHRARRAFRIVLRHALDNGRLAHALDLGRLAHALDLEGARLEALGEVGAFHTRKPADLEQELAVAPYGRVGDGVVNCSLYLGKTLQNTTKLVLKCKVLKM